MGTTTGSDSCPDKGSASNPLLFDFKGFLEGGALDDVFGIPTGPTYAPTLNSASGDVDDRWEVTRLIGGSINVTVRAAPPPGRGGDKLARNAKSVVMKYAPPYVAAIGEGAPFGTFRQVSTRTLPLQTPTPPPSLPALH